MRRRSLGLGLGLLALILSAACGSSYVRLDPKKVRGVGIKLKEQSQTYCPNGPLWPEVIAVISYDGGKVFESETPNHHGKVRWSDVDWKTDAGRIHKGLWLLPYDLLGWHDRDVSVSVAIPTRPELSSSLKLSPRFDCGGTGEYRGPDGYDAQEWSGTGEPGFPGPRLDVALAYVDTTRHGRLVLVRVIDHTYGRRQYHLVDPRSAQRFHIDAGGGRGGRGAAGRNGADGKNGASGDHGANSSKECENGGNGSPGHPGADGTPGSAGGHGGPGGDGGHVVVTVPTAFPELATAIDVSAGGAAGGPGGTGGKGGEGGEGGQGGNGGFAGFEVTDPNTGVTCETRPGIDGQRGPNGQDAPEGAEGFTGPSGQQGSISAATEDLEKLWAFEIARGWKIVR